MRQIQSAGIDQLNKLVLADLISTAQEIELFEWASRTVQKYRLDTINAISDPNFGPTDDKNAIETHF